MRYTILVYKITHKMEVPCTKRVSYTKKKQVVYLFLATKSPGKCKHFLAFFAAFPTDTKSKHEICQTFCDTIVTVKTFHYFFKAMVPKKIF
jgi:hypothetical protein